MDLVDPTKKMSKSAENPKGVIFLLDEEKDIRSVRRFSNNNVKELVKGGKRTNIPNGHYLENYGLKTIPERK